MSAAAFRAAAEAADHEAMVATLADGVVLNSPITFRPFEGRDAVGFVLRAVMETFQDFRYTDELPGEDAHGLVFRARVGDREVEGVDLLRLDDAGLVADLTVFVRPLSGATALAEAMAAKVGHLK